MIAAAGLPRSCGLPRPLALSSPVEVVVTVVAVDPPPCPTAIARFFALPLIIAPDLFEDFLQARLLLGLFAHRWFLLPPFLGGFLHLLDLA
jgi:hypothetical protein